MTEKRTNERTETHACDCISRKAAIDELIAMREHIDARMSVIGCTAYEMAIEALRDPKIIRCKDCKYMTEHYYTDGNVPYWTCSEWDSGTDYDGFCHYAERRTDDTR